ncbi:MAG TPA: helix-hairpin-helix domain-containing protein [Blastocatellia bacterium]|nr:helix-hairpin-helix domain-containing protein [Blastocatellia bacterium]
MIEIIRWSLAGVFLLFVAMGASRYVETRRTKLLTAPAVPFPPETARCDIQATSESGRALAPVQRLSLNRASRQDLERLPGIGPVLADEIIRLRERHGPFQKVEDLLIVPGIGPERFRRLAPMLCVE